jgi:hypothetical protein
MFAMTTVTLGHAEDSPPTGNGETAVERTSTRFVRLGNGAGYTHVQVGKHDGSEVVDARTVSTWAVGILNLEATFGTRTSERNAFYGWSVLEMFVVPKNARPAFRGSRGGIGWFIKLGIGDEVSFGDDRVTLSFAAGSVLQLYAFPKSTGEELPPVDNAVRADVAPGLGGEIQLAFRLNDTTRPDGLAIYGGSHVVFRDGRRFVGGQVGLRAIVWRRGMK